jgi:hypothetical protein
MMKTQYVRLYADSDGESHFSDEEMELTAVNFAPPAPPINISASTPAKHFALLNSPEGWFGDWHPTPYRQFFFLLSGKVETGVSDGEVRLFGPGSILLVEDTTGRGHTSRVIDEGLAVSVQLAES